MVTTRFNVSVNLSTESRKIEKVHINQFKSTIMETSQERNNLKVNKNLFDF